MAEDSMTPEQARTRFGELQEPVTRTYVHFTAPEGDWRPVLGPGLTLEEYRLYKRYEGVRPTHWPRPKRKR